ncbi:MAG: transposase [Bacteroidales bacterium]|nr:transposase [Bacteroidales bacterium]
MVKIVKQYSDEDKIRIIKEYLETDQSQKDLMRKYGIRGNSAITNWIRKFGYSKPEDESQITKVKIPNNMSCKSKREKELEAKLKKLEQEIEYEKLRNHALDTLINVAERDLNVPIRKKLGAKQ